MFYHRSFKTTERFPTVSVNEWVYSLEAKFDNEVNIYLSHQLQQ